MALFSLALAFLVQAAAPAAPAPAPAAAPTPVRARQWQETGPAPTSFARGAEAPADAAILANAGYGGPKAADRRLAQRRARVVAEPLMGNGIPPAVIVQRPVGQSVPRVMTPDGVPDPFSRYALIIFPVPPPR